MDADSLPIHDSGVVPGLSRSYKEVEMKHGASVLTVLLLSACMAVPSSIGERVYRGLYASGFEVESFQPCGSGETWWVTEGRELRTRYRQVAQRPYEAAYVVVRGKVSSEGSYGHLGGYTRELSVHDVVELRLATGQDCGY